MPARKAETALSGPGWEMSLAMTSLKFSPRSEVRAVVWRDSSSLPIRERAVPYRWMGKEIDEVSETIEMRSHSIARSVAVEPSRRSHFGCCVDVIPSL